MQHDLPSMQSYKSRAIRQKQPLISHGCYGRNNGQRASRSISKSAKISSPNSSDASGERGTRSVNVYGFCVVNDIAFISRQTNKQHSDELENYEMSDSSSLSGEWLW